MGWPFFPKRTRTRGEFPSRRAQFDVFAPHATFLPITVISDAYYEVEVIGEFPEGEARAFFEWRLQFSVEEAPPPLDDASWARIYEVRAGGPSRPRGGGRGPFRGRGRMRWTTLSR